jgi:hypothetical protein
MNNYPEIKLLNKCHYCEKEFEKCIYGIGPFIFCSKECKEKWIKTTMNIYYKELNKK